MTLTANDRKFTLEDIFRDLKSLAVVLGSARRKIYLHDLRSSEGCRYVHTTLAEAATALEVLATTIQDLILLEGIEMDEKQREMQNQIGHQAASPAPPAAGPAENTSASPAAGQEGISQQEQKHLTALADTLGDAIAGSLKQAVAEDRADLIDAIVAAIGVGKINGRLGGIEKQLEKLQTLCVLLDQMRLKIKRLDVIEAKFGGTDRMDRFEEQLEGLNVIDVRLGKIEEKFTGIGKALDVIARVTQQNMAAAGNNADDAPENKEQGG